MSEYMLFCLGDGKYESKGESYQKNYRIFNKDVEKKEWETIKNSLPTIKVSMLTWIDKKDMSDNEKETYPVYNEIGGYLKKISYEDAWKLWWDNATAADRQKITDIKYFDAKIFKGITGLDVEAQKSLSGKKVRVELDGVSYSATID